MNWLFTMQTWLESVTSVTLVAGSAGAALCCAGGGGEFVDWQATSATAAVMPSNEKRRDTSVRVNMTV